MTNWQFFQTLMTQLLAVLQAATAGMLNGAIGYARPAVAIGAVVVIAVRAIEVASGRATLRAIYHDMIRIAIVLFLLQAANYNQYISTVAQAIPTGVGTALATAGANTGNIASGAAFDNVWNAAAKAGLDVWNEIPKYSLASIPLWIAVMIYLAIALVAIGVSFLVYLASTVLLLLLLAVGPLFVALFAFPQAAKFGAGWVAAVASTLVTQILAVAVLVMFVGVEQTTVTRIVTGVAGGANANFINDIVTLAEGALLMWLVSLLVKQTPAIAQAISGGVYQQVSGMIAKATKAVASTAQAATAGVALGARGVSAGARAAGSAAMAARGSHSQPTGRSLSGSGYQFPPGG